MGWKFVIYLNYGMTLTKIVLILVVHISFFMLSLRKSVHKKKLFFNQQNFCFYQSLTRDKCECKKCTAYNLVIVKSDEKNHPVV